VCPTLNGLKIMISIPPAKLERSLEETVLSSPIAPSMAEEVSIPNFEMKVNNKTQSRTSPEN
jgi:hypothetical protein